MSKDDSGVEGCDRDFDSLVQRIRAGLKAGGPAVNFAAIHLYIAGDLNVADARRVRELVVTWESWNKAYWETVAALDEAKSYDVQGELGSQRQAEPDHVVNKAQSPSLRRWLVALVATGASVTIVIGLVLSRGTWRREVASITDGVNVLTEYSDGHVDGLEAYPEGRREAIADVMRNKRLSYPQDKLSFVGGTRSAARTSMYVSPVDTVVREQRPSFRWKERGKDAKYRVIVYPKSSENESREAPTGSGRAMTTSGVLTTPTWRPEVDLARGRVYYWRVDVMIGGNEFVSDEPEPVFKVLSESELKEVEVAVAHALDSHLIRALIYSEAGLLDEAMSELRYLAESDTGVGLRERLVDSLRRPR